VSGRRKLAAASLWKFGGGLLADDEPEVEGLPVRVEVVRSEDRPEGRVNLVAREPRRHPDVFLEFTDDEALLLVERIVEAIRS
jgi:hypothetical protein